ncbi:Alginate lyase [compost metagenome]
MPVKRLVLLAALAAPFAQAGAIQSIWQTPAASATPAAGDYRGLRCPKEIPPPITQALLVDSKYDQSDPTRSTLGQAPSRDSERIHRGAGEYAKMLSLFVDYYAKAGEARQAEMALACMDQWLTAWAQAGALESRETTKTGSAVRKWTLVAISSSILRMQALSAGRLQLDERQRAWLDRLAAIVVDEYEPRLAPSFAYFNNHDYWAAWSLGSTGMVLGKQSDIDWSEKVFRRAMQQITPSASGDYAYLPNELARGRLAANYTHYALVPLVLVAETLRANGGKVSAEDDRKLGLLANFAARSALDPAGLPELKGQRQEAVPAYKMAWLIPFLGHDPKHPLARRLYDHERGEVDGYRQIGGRIKPFYPAVD